MFPHSLNPHPRLILFPPHAPTRPFNLPPSLSAPQVSQEREEITYLRADRMRARVVAGPEILRLTARLGRLQASCPYSSPASTIFKF
jgi:hypothetical protein